MLIGCDACGTTRLFTVMVKNEVWDQISEDRRSVLCLDCMEARLGRRITLHDLRPCNQSNVMLLGAYVARNTPDLHDIDAAVLKGSEEGEYRTYRGL